MTVKQIILKILHHVNTCILIVIWSI